MGKHQRDSRGFTLIAALLLTVLLSAIAVGLMFVVTNESRMGGNDLEDNLAYYGAEAGIEDLTYQLANLYQTSQNPGTTALNALTNASNYPTAISGSNITNMQYVESITWPTTDSSGVACPNPPCSSWDVVGAGSDQGMVAQLIPFTLNVTATRQAGAGEVAQNSAIAPTGASVNLTRTVEVALLPAFEFGIFCDGDCDYFAGPDFNFGGRVHTNGNLFLADGGNLIFGDKIAAVGQVIMDQLENGWPTSNGYTGAVYVPSAANGCASGAGSSCLKLETYTTGSWTGGFPPTGAQNTSNWPSTATTFNGYIINGATGATKLQLPFVQSAGAVGSVDIIRRPTPGDSILLSSSRLFTMAQIRILLADTETELHPERPALMGDADDIQLTTGAAITTPAGAMYFAQGKPSTGYWTAPTGCSGSNPWPLHGEVTAATQCQAAWLRVEYLNSTSTWVGVTRQWLGYGFGKFYNTEPTGYAGNSGQNGISPAILVLQELRPDITQSASNAVGSTSTNNWLPINFYDAREGEPRDSRPSGANSTSCGPIGVMNSVELDTGNLWRWLQGLSPYGGGSGLSVMQSSTAGGGYILYFSDHRGMQPEPTAQQLTPFYNNISGVSGLEDTINSSSANGVPDGTLEGASYYPYSPEDVDNNGALGTFGKTYLGAGFGLSGAPMSQPYYISGTSNGITCAQTISSVLTPTTAAWNMVSGPRHVLRLVDGGMTGGISNLPHPNSVNATGNGFTVASEEPVYVWGNYNSDSSDPFWGNPTPANAAAALHSAAAIIADAVTLLSPSWSDAVSFTAPGTATTRNASDSYYRVAIAAGKSVPFPEPGWASGGGLKDFGTDGGMHNFLRYLEDRSGTTVYYMGSMISMYPSQYATGVFKCCNAVYDAPTRKYYFDTQFLNPSNLPPGTPMFQDVVSLSYHQSFTPQ